MPATRSADHDRIDAMRDLRRRYTYNDRLEFQNTISDLRAYLLVILMNRQDGVCAICLEPADRYDIDHGLYNPMMNIDHLRALCEPCHKSVTDYRPFRNR